MTCLKIRFWFEWFEKLLIAIYNTIFLYSVTMVRMSRHTIYRLKEPAKNMITGNQNHDYRYLLS